MRITFICFLLLATLRCAGFSVLTHEAIIDASWDKGIKPLLLLKYPGATEEQIRKARAYAYGGSVAPDIGYYPFGSELFTDLLHYVRSGDFVTALLEEAEDLNEYAFALGVLCHYNADKYGHPLATNRCVALAYPEIGKKYGPVVTYEQDPLAHVRIEFGFDVLQTARGNYAPDNYHDFIGFKVPADHLERAFYRTYGLHIKDIFRSLPRAISVFRWVVRSLVPAITKSAWASKKKDIITSNPGITRRRFEYRMRQAVYDDFGREKEKPGLLPTALSIVIRAVPKIGPLKKYRIQLPGPQGEILFIRSFDTVLSHYNRQLASIPDSTSHFPNTDIDTGEEAAHGEYGLADRAHGILLLKLKEHDFRTVTNPLKESILHFYKHDSRGQARATNKEWRRITAALGELKQAPPVQLQ